MGASCCPSTGCQHYSTLIWLSQFTDDDVTDMHVLVQWLLTLWSVNNTSNLLSRSAPHKPFKLKRTASADACSRTRCVFSSCLHYVFRTLSVILHVGSFHSVSSHSVELYYGCDRAYCCIVCAATVMLLLLIFWGLLDLSPPPSAVSKHFYWLMSWGGQLDTVDVSCDG